MSPSFLQPDLALLVHGSDKFLPQRSQRVPGSCLRCYGHLALLGIYMLLQAVETGWRGKWLVRFSCMERRNVCDGVCKELNLKGYCCSSCIVLLQLAWIRKISLLKCLVDLHDYKNEAQSILYDWLFCAWVILQITCCVFGWEKLAVAN